MNRIIKCLSYAPVIVAFVPAMCVKGACRIVAVIGGTLLLVGQGIENILDANMHRLIDWTEGKTSASITRTFSS